MNERLGHSTYLIHRKFLQLLGATLYVYDPAGQLALYAKLKAFKLKEDIRLYTDESMEQEVLVIKARNIIDFAAAYDVHDSATGEKVGVLKRKGLKSILRDEWILMDAEDREIGLIREDSTFLAIIRRFITNLIPQDFRVEVGGAHVGTFRQNFNPFVSRLNVDFSADAQGRLDRRLGLAAAILLCVVEGKQQ